MTTAQTIARLEALLARVQGRATEPRRRGVPAAVVAAVAVVPAPAVAPPEAVAIPDLAVPEDEVTLAQRALPGAGPAAEVTEVEVAIDLDVAEPAAGAVVVATEEVAAAEPFESRERLVAAEAVAEAPAPLEPPRALASGTVEDLAAEEDVEDAPASSRRPVAPEPEERLAEMAFGAEEPRPPRHTPPPESGRLPAAPVVEFDADVTGVREAPAVAEPRRPREVVPEATRASLESSEEIAEIVGIAAAGSPATFLALLEVSLAL